MIIITVLKEIILKNVLALSSLITIANSIEFLCCSVAKMCFIYTSELTNKVTQIMENKPCKMHFEILDN